MMFKKNFKMFKKFIIFYIIIYFLKKIKNHFKSKSKSIDVTDDVITNEIIYFTSRIIKKIKY